MTSRSCLAFFVALAAACEQTDRGDLGPPQSFAEVSRVIAAVRGPRKLDVLLVIDDSAAMAGIQEVVAANMRSLVDVLEDPSVAVDYRIGVITSSVEHPACADEVAAGTLRMTSCRERLGDFEGAMGGCADACTFDTIRTLPTTTTEDPVARPRPWLEARPFASNLAPLDGRTPTTAEALQCAGPQGADGCEFPSPLEAMHRALLRMQDVDDPQYGFLRDDAALLIVIMTNGNDCSVVPAHASLFSPVWEGGIPTFWSDKSADAPTRAACWNAGVECTGGPQYEECHPSNHAATGEPDVDDAHAVLHPISRYVEQLENIERAKQAIDPNLQVVVELIAGVPPGYEDGQSEVYYADATDPAEQREYGIGAGCLSNSRSPAFTARPPVRELAVAAAMQIDDERNAISTCEDDWSPAFEAIAEPIRDILKPACMTACVADADRDTPALEPTCYVEWSAANDEGGVLHVCNADETVPDGENACAVPLVDEALSDYCSDEGWNLEYRLVSRDGFLWPGPVLVSATCLASMDRATDCPGLD